MDLVRESFRAARSAGRRARSRKCDPAQPTTIEVILGSHSWQAAQQHPMVLGCAAVAFLLVVQCLVPLAPQAARHKSNGCKRRNDCIVCS